MRITLFFYGSLRKGEHNFERFDREWPGALKEVGAGRINGWELVDLGSYPSLVPGPAGSSVAGEVYEVTADVFRHIETLEAGAGYRRETAAVHLASGGPPIEAFIYYFSRPSDIADRPRVKGGDWKRRLRRTSD